MDNNQNVKMKDWLQKLIDRSKWAEEEQKTLKKFKTKSKPKPKIKLPEQLSAQEKKFKQRFGDNWHRLNLNKITPEQQTKYCLRCPLPECIDCFGDNSKRQ